jgi:hypothetical protein
LSHLSKAWLILLQFNNTWFYLFLFFLFADQKCIFLSHFFHACRIPIQCHHWSCLSDNISWVTTITDFIQFSLASSYSLLDSVILLSRKFFCHRLLTHSCALRCVYLLTLVSSPTPFDVYWHQKTL